MIICYYTIIKRKRMDIYSLLKLLSCGLVHILFKNKIARRRIIKVIRKLGDSKEEVEEALEKISELKPLFLAKKAMKYLDEADVDKYLKNYLKKRGINLDNIKENFKEWSSKSAVKKIQSVLSSLDETDRISELKEQKLKKDMEDLLELTGRIASALDEYKKDIRRNVEKKLIEKEGEINELEKEKIKEEGVREFVNKMKGQQAQAVSLKQGVSLGNKRIIKR